jgi:lysyl-tRNA synthetase, class II
LSHNPEFTTCEFYRAYTNLEGLIELTENLITGLVTYMKSNMLPKMSSLDLPKTNFKPPFKRLDFITEIERAMQEKLPLLSEIDAHENILRLLTTRQIPVSEASTLPQMLDKLCSTYLEPQCTEPTFIINHPECMSPLAKSFMHPTVQGQKVAARAELFVAGSEIANMYEEENSPLEQRRKFVEQLQYRNADEASGMGVDEAYLEALEWGLPPVGGWGCGIERLCMILTGTARIADVLSFGTLRNVVSRHART